MRPSDLLNGFAAEIRSRYPDARVLLIGSRARGDNRPDSDYDLIVISDAFASVSPLWRGHGLHRTWAHLGAEVDVDIVCITPAEWERAREIPSSWLPEAAAEAVPIAVPPPRAA